MYLGFLFLIISIIGLIVTIPPCIYCSKKDDSYYSMAKKWYYLSWLYSIFVGIFIAMFIVCIIFSICAPLCCITKIEQFEQTRTMVNEVYNNSSISDNYGVTNSVIEANKWLARSKANAKIWGWASYYYFMNIEDVQPITLPKDKE